MLKIICISSVLHGIVASGVIMQMPPTLKIFQNGSAIIEQLRNKGKHYLVNGEYNQAADCYAAILQNLEGAGGPEAGHLMRRCGITLAECEIKLGNLFDAVARCTEVIDESPEMVTSDSVQVTLGKAYYRRSVAFQRLNMPRMAYLDLNQASKYLPDDGRIRNSMKILSNSNDISSIEISEDELQDTLEEALKHFPRRIFSRREIVELIYGPNSGYTENAPLKRPIKSSFNDIMKSFGDGTEVGEESAFDLQSLMSGQGSGGGESPLGALGGLGNMLGGGGLGSLLSSVMEPGNLQNYMEIFQACNNFRKWLGDVINQIKANHGIILGLLSVLWLWRLLI
jgi:tetratricopeptide (TPR) repeat protein